jgi:hypothetical protein
VTPDIHAMLRAQSGVIARWQVLGLGGSDALLRRLLGRRELVAVYRGVYVAHTGPLTWEQRSWAAALFYWPAALAHRSCLRAHGVRDTRLVRDGDGDIGPIHVAIDASRRVRRVDGVRVHHVRGLAQMVQPNREPPRLRLEHALLDVASDAYSALERRYLVRVERRHGLPTDERQRRVGRALGYRDVVYRRWRMVVELDGRLGHELAADRWADLDRDIDALEEEQITVRLGWKQVLDACRAAVVVARLLRARGWADTPRPCSRDCAVRRFWPSP